MNVPQHHRQLEEVRHEGHLDRVRVAPCCNLLHLSPLLVLHEGDEGVLVPGSPVLSEHSVLHAETRPTSLHWPNSPQDSLEDCWQCRHHEPAGEAGAGRHVHLAHADLQVLAPASKLLPGGLQSSTGRTPRSVTGGRTINSSLRCSSYLQFYHPLPCQDLPPVVLCDGLEVGLHIADH